MKRTRLERRAEKLHVATGLGWAEALKRARRLAPTAPLIPEAQEQQAILEGYFLEQHAWPLISTRNPWGICSTDPRPDALVLTFEDEDANREFPGESMARELVRLLPRVSEGELRGIPGARFSIEGGTIVLRRVNLPGSIILAGVGVEDWLTALELQTRDYDSDGVVMCQAKAPDHWHSSEKPYRSTKAHTVQARRNRLLSSSSWVASGMLRRAPLLRTIGVPLSTTAWSNLDRDHGGHEWIIDYIHEPLVRAPSHHQAFIGLLTDPECGLPITVEDLDCGCRLPAEYGYGCRVYAHSATGRPGGLQVRFSHRLGRRARRFTTDRDYEARRRLYRRLPAHLKSD
ncbi:hypothetical protein [Streptomyces sp. MNP-20]|uniref:hypothetical protein n=1 Tax=Streptomyces sp. MNP-20 TaxID=2721165 RepID=UPI0015575CFB|nr:hypothetical protein [Streptomyces sp. MNP-20]